jgi:hypothetical protein
MGVGVNDVDLKHLDISREKPWPRAETDRSIAGQDDGGQRPAEASRFSRSG